MSSPRLPPRSSPQFTLRALLAFTALAALQLAVAHYWLYGPTFFRLIFPGSAGIAAVAMVLALFLVVGLPELWQERARKATIAGLILRVVAVGAAIYTIAWLLAGLLVPG